MSELRLDLENFHENRLKSQQQREKIVLDSFFTKWKKSDATTTTMIERGIGMAAFPVIAFWGLFLSFISIGMALALVILKFIGGIAGRRK